MSTKQTGSSQEKKLIPNDWMPTSATSKTKLTKLTAEEVEEKLQDMMDESIVDGNQPNRSVDNENENSMDADSSIQSKNGTNAIDSLQTESAVEIRSTSKRISGKQRKESLEEYRETFLQVPKLDDRKPVFISREVRDSLDEIARKLGGRRMSVSGFIENLARHHLEIYQDEVELWKKL